LLPATRSVSAKASTSQTLPLCRVPVIFYLVLYLYRLQQIYFLEFHCDAPSRKVRCRLAVLHQICLLYATGSFSIMIDQFIVLSHERHMESVTGIASVERVCNLQYRRGRDSFLLTCHCCTAVRPYLLHGGGTMRVFLLAVASSYLWKERTRAQNELASSSDTTWRRCVRSVALQCTQWPTPSSNGNDTVADRYLQKLDAIRFVRVNNLSHCKVGYVSESEIDQDRSASTDATNRRSQEMHFVKRNARSIRIAISSYGIISFVLLSSVRELTFATDACRHRCAIYLQYLR